MALCSFTIFGTVPVKNGALSAAAPAVKSLAAGSFAHSAAMAGLRPFMRGSKVPLSAGSIVPIKGSLSTQGLEQAAGSSPCVDKIEGVDHSGGFIPEFQDASPE